MPWFSKTLLLGVALGLTTPSVSLAAESKPAAAKAAAKTKAAAKPETKAAAKTQAPRLSAAEVVKRNLAARGGGQAWRSVQALAVSGKMDAGPADSVARSMSVMHSSSRKGRRELAAKHHEDPAATQVQLPFKLARQRPNRSRLEIEVAGKTAVQVYDGKNGWKVRPFLNRNDAEPFTAEEAKLEAQSPDIDGLLIGAQAKGAKVEYAGVEKVLGRDAYKLKVTTRAGIVRHVWVDAKTFLDVKVEGNPRQLDGKLHTVWVYQRDFRSVDGVKIPFLLETVVDGYPQAHKIVFEKVAVNPKLDGSAFAKPKA